MVGLGALSGTAPGPRPACNLMTGDEMGSSGRFLERAIRFNPHRPSALLRYNLFTLPEATPKRQVDLEAGPSAQPAESAPRGEHGDKHTLLEHEMTDEMGIFEVMYHCRAMRRLRPDPVPEDLLVRLIDAANHAPSGANAQPARWIVVRDAAQRQRIADLNLAAVRVYMQMRADRPLQPHQETGRQERIGQAVVRQAEHLHEVPALVFACLELGAARADTFMAGLSAGGSVWPGVQNLLLAARALGLGATPTTIVFRDRAAVKAVLNLPAAIEPVCMIPVGYPLGRFGPVTRQPVQEIMHWDRWS